MRSNISSLLIGSEIQFDQLLFNCVSSAFPMPLLTAHGMCLIHAYCSGVLSLHLSRRRWCCETRLPWRCVLQRGLHLWGAVSSRSIASSWLGAGASTRRLLVHNWINNLLHFTQVFNIVISLSQVLRINIMCLCHCYVHIYHDNLILFNLYSRKYFCYTHCCSYCGIAHNNIFYHVILIIAFNLQ